MEPPSLLLGVDGLLCGRPIVAYFPALQDVLTGMNGTGNARRSTWSPGESAV